MIRSILALGFLGLASSAGAQGLPAKDDVTLTMARDEARLIVQTLDAIGCQSVAQLAVCIKAMELKRKMQQQIIGQDKQ